MAHQGPVGVVEWLVQATLGITGRDVKQRQVKAIEAGKNNLTIQTIGGIAEQLKISAVGLMLDPERVY